MSLMFAQLVPTRDVDAVQRSTLNFPFSLLTSFGSGNTLPSYRYLLLLLGTRTE